MKLKAKIFLGISVIILILLFFFALMISFVSMRSFGQLDYERSVRNIARINETLTQYQETLKEKVSDWAVWDDTYDYLKGDNQEFVIRNLIPSAFKNLNIQHIVFLTSEKTVKSSWSVDFDTGEFATQAADLVAEVLNNNPIPDLSDNESVTGYLEVPQIGPVIFASRRVYRSDNSGPSAGILLFGQNLNRDLTSKISQITKSQVSLEKNNIDIPTGQVTTFTKPDQPPDMKYYYIDSGHMLATIPISTYYGSRIGLINLITNRESERLGWINRIYFLSSLGVVGVVICIFVLVFMNLVILRRLRVITSVVHNITKSNKLDSRIPVSGFDEMAEFSRDLNNMFESLQKAHEFITSKDDLEKIVRERTEDLRIAKKALEEKLTEQEKLNSLMVGRELKMIELKKEIDELKQKTGNS